MLIRNSACKMISVASVSSLVGWLRQICKSGGKMDGEYAGNVSAKLAALSLSQLGCIRKEKWHTSLTVAGVINGPDRQYNDEKQRHSTESCKNSTECKLKVHWRQYHKPWRQGSRESTQKTLCNDKKMTCKHMIEGNVMRGNMQVWWQHDQSLCCELKFQSAKYVFVGWTARV